MRGMHPVPRTANAEILTLTSSPFASIALRYCKLVSALLAIPSVLTRPRADKESSQNRLRAANVCTFRQAPHAMSPMRSSRKGMYYCSRSDPSVKSLTVVWTFGSSLVRISRKPSRSLIHPSATIVRGGTAKAAASRPASFRLQRTPSYRPRRYYDPVTRLHLSSPRSALVVAVTFNRYPPFGTRT